MAENSNLNNLRWSIPSSACSIFTKSAIENIIGCKNCPLATDATTDTPDNSNSGAGVISEFTGIKEFTTNEDLSVLNNYATIGALLSWNGSKYTVWNGDGTNWAYNSRVNVVGYYSFENGVDEYTAPSTQYGTVIAVCVGLGKWAATGWSGLTNTKTWQPGSSRNDSNALNMYHPSMVHGTGKQNTDHVLENHDSVLAGTIWDDIKSYTCGNGLKVFLPSKYELLECQENLCDGVHKEDQNAEGTTTTEACSYNKQIAKLLSCSTDSYWSSSQYSFDYSYAFVVYFSDGYVNYYYKSNSCRSLVLLRF